MTLLPWTTVIAAHAVTATASIVLGGFNMIRKTKGDRLHKAIGRSWAGLMYFVAAISFFIGGKRTYEQPLGIFLHGLAAWTIISISFGIYFAKKNNIIGHRAFMVGTYLGLIGATIGVISVPSRRIPSYFAAHPLLMSLLTLGIVSLSCLSIQAIALIISSNRPLSKIS